MLSKLFPKGRRFLYFEYPWIWIQNIYYRLKGSPIRATIWRFEEKVFPVAYMLPDDFLNSPADLWDDIEVTKLARERIAKFNASLLEQSLKSNTVIEPVKKVKK